MRHHVTIELTNGRNTARCQCGWRFPEPIEGDPSEPVGPFTPSWGRYTIEEVLEAGQTHRLESDEEPWVCTLADELGGFVEDWLRDNLIERGHLEIDHEHLEDGEPASEITLTVRIGSALPAELLELDAEDLTHEERQEIAAASEEV